MAKRQATSTPGRWRMRRNQRLDAARAWINSGARVTVKTYAKWFHVDRHCAYLELQTLGVPLAEADRRWSTPAPVKLRRKRPEPPQGDPGIPDWIWYAGELIFVVGETSNGVAYGLTLEQMQELDPDHDWSADAHA